MFCYQIQNNSMLLADVANPAHFIAQAVKIYQSIQSNKETGGGHPKIEEMDESEMTDPAALFSETSDMPPLIADVDHEKPFSLQRGGNK
jgi:hypothetical protein